MTPSSPSPRPSPVKGEGVFLTFYDFIKNKKTKSHTDIDGFVKSPFCPIFVIPAKAGIHPAEDGTAFAGVTALLTFYEIVNMQLLNFAF